jgi:small-conductance mechanosensitive channel/CRP-like cAMP-binding protein
LPAPAYRRLTLPASVVVATMAVSALSHRAPAWTGLGDRLIGIVSDASSVVLWIAGAWLAARFLDLLLHRAAISGPHPAPYPRLLSDLIHGALFILAAIGILVFVFDQAATGLIATSSVLIAVVGFALRYVISDVFSGIALGFDHPYRIGDWIEPGPGIVGKVVEITWRTTRLVTRDGTAIVVPNGLIAIGRLVNYSGPTPSFRVAFRLSLDPEVAPNRAKHILLAGALAATHAYPDLRPDVLLQEWSDAGVSYGIRFWVPDYEQENACRDAVMSGVLHALRRAGLTPSAPRRELVTAPRDLGLTRPRKLAETLLADTALFSAFSAEERAVLADRLAERRVEQGTTVVRQGDPASTLFFVREGALEVRVANGAGIAVAVNRLGAGDLFGEMSLLTGEPRSASVVALTDAALYELRKEDLSPMLAQRPELSEALAELMTARQRGGRARLDAVEGATELELRSSPARMLSRLRSFFGLSDSG